MSNKLYLGIDTSNYTTSLAVVREDGTVLANHKKLLPVKEGERGLRQSDAVFAHVKNFPELSPLLRETLDGVREQGEIAAVGYSAKPRDADGSYMPCFLVGTALAETTAAILGVPAHRFSHQAGHIAAAAYSAGLPDHVTSFFAFHVSGGTTEILAVERTNPASMRIRLVGGTDDLNAGQVIDRVGVSLGFPFPAGPNMEKAALAYTEKIKRHAVSVTGTTCHLSGAENLAAGMKAAGEPDEAIAAFVLDFVGNTLLKLTDNLVMTHGSRPIVYAGGVMSCSILKQKIAAAYPDAYFAAPAFSADNAAGIALLTRRAAQTRERGESV